MRNHKLVQAGLGIGLLATSLGAAAQPATWTFDYSMMFLAPTSVGSKYVAFVPTLTRSANGTGGVLMLELFQGSAATQNTWGYAIGGPIGAAADGAGAAATSSAGGFIVAANGATGTGKFFQGDVIGMAHTFSHTALGSASQACNISFTASIGTNNQLAFASVSALPTDWAPVQGADPTLYRFTTSNNANSTVDIATSLFRSGSATVATYAYTASGADMIVKYNRCVTAYTNRKSGSNSLVGTGLIRVW